MADAAILPADPAIALQRARQGKSYWRRVWERLRDDKVTLAVIGVLVMLLIMVVFAPWGKPTTEQTFTSVLDRNSRARANPAGRTSRQDGQRTSARDPGSPHSAKGEARRSRY
jgi:hypothetical protein